MLRLGFCTKSQHSAWSTRGDGNKTGGTELTRWESSFGPRSLAVVWMVGCCCFAEAGSCRVELMLCSTSVSLDPEPVERFSAMPTCSELCNTTVSVLTTMSCRRPLARKNVQLMPILVVEIAISPQALLAH